MLLSSQFWGNSNAAVRLFLCIYLVNCKNALNLQCSALEIPVLLLWCTVLPQGWRLLTAKFTMQLRFTLPCLILDNTQWENGSWAICPWTLSPWLLIVPGVIKSYLGRFWTKIQSDNCFETVSFFFTSICSVINTCELKWQIWPSTSMGTMVFCWSCKQSWSWSYAN